MVKYRFGVRAMLSQEESDVKQQMLQKNIEI